MPAFRGVLSAREAQDLVAWVVAVSDFEPLPRQSCAACHHVNAAGDGCTTCHRYHITQ